MPGLEALGRWLVLLGLGMILLGGLVWMVARFFPNLTRFPGTIRIQGGGMTCVFPVLASILLSIILTVLLNLITRFLNK
jgi:hypothetical protein